MAKIILIAAMAKNRVIGLHNQLIWHIPSDLKHFKKLTAGHLVIMGRKTFQSIGRPLPNRINVVITRNIDFKPREVEIFHSLADAIRAYSHLDSIYIAGGAELYRQALPLAHQMELTIIDREYDGDTTFPDFNPDEWQVVHSTSCTDQDRGVDVTLTFVTLIRKDPCLTTSQS